ncbi:MAG: hypothetical protein J6B31_02365 [Bacteroidaceae bacterium]|nr:hypothetical protein [Bacteroidaceae bacterium]
MKYSKLLLIIIMIVSLGGACQRKPQEQSMEEFISTFIQKYPKATLQDIYKGGFQDVFGPAHLLTNRKSVKNYIVHELNTAQSFEASYYEPCSWKGNFYRVNLSVIRDGKVSMDEFIDAFMGSANGIDTTLTQSWIEEWNQIQQAVRATLPNLKGYEEDYIHLSRLLKEGKYIVHHSRIFNTTYHPHYRIIRKDLFDKIILPKLK